MNKKNISKFIALALISTLTLTTFEVPLKAQAMTNNLAVNEIVNLDDYDMNHLLNLLKERYNKSSENEFEIKSEGYTAIINSETGNITHNFYDEAGVLIDSYTTNYYENLKNISEEFVVSPRNTLATNSIPYKLNSQHYTIAQYSAGQKLYAQNSNNKSKSYYLSGKYTSNATVMNFVSAVDKTASKARLLVNTTGASAGIAIVGFFGLGGKITAAALTAALKALGYVTLVGGAVAITNLYNDYVDARIDADHKFNAL